MAGGDRRGDGNIEGAKQPSQDERRDQADLSEPISPESQKPQEGEAARESDGQRCEKVSEEERVSRAAMESDRKGRADGREEDCPSGVAEKGASCEGPSILAVTDLWALGVKSISVEQQGCEERQGPKE